MNGEQTREQTNLDEYGRAAESDCARAMAEAERVLRELSCAALSPQRSNPGSSSSVDEKLSEQSLVSSRPRGSLTALPLDRLRLDPDLDFIAHDDGVIELTEAGFRCLPQILLRLPLDGRTGLGP
jgi:hypothetical protein